MNIYEVRNNYLNSGREKEFSMLIDLYEKTRNCSLNGYLGSGNILLSILLLIVHLSLMVLFWMIVC